MNCRQVLKKIDLSKFRSIFHKELDGDCHKFMHVACEQIANRGYKIQAVKIIELRHELQSTLVCYLYIDSSPSEAAELTVCLIDSPFMLDFNSELLMKFSIRVIAFSEANQTS